jgi:hypothetical protein
MPDYIIRLNHPDLVARFMAPGESVLFDSFYLLLIIAVSTIGLFTFSNFSYENPFTRKTTIGMYLLTGVLILFIVAKVFRSEWFSDYLFHETGENLVIDSGRNLYLTEMILTAIVMRLAVVFRKGTRLQEEQDQTV